MCSWHTPEESGATHACSPWGTEVPPWCKAKPAWQAKHLLRYFLSFLAPPCQCTAGQVQRAAPHLTLPRLWLMQEHYKRQSQTLLLQNSQGSALGEVNKPEGELPCIFSWVRLAAPAVASASPECMLPALGTAQSLIPLPVIRCCWLVVLLKGWRREEPSKRRQCLKPGWATLHL